MLRALLATLLFLTAGLPSFAQVRSGLGYACESTSGRCFCTGYFDCRNMEKEVCKGPIEICAPKANTCECDWLKIKKPVAGHGRIITGKPPVAK